MITDKKILSRADFGYVLKMPCAKNIICGFSTREFNYDFRAGSSPKTHQDISDKREKFFKSLGLNIRNSVFLKQVHRAKIKKITKADQGKGAYDYESSIAETDAAITNLRDTPLCVLSADCLPLVFWHPRKDVIGIAHAGWRGLKAGIAFKTVQKIVRTYKCLPREIRVFFAPGIRACCYEVDSLMKQHFKKHIFVFKNRLYLDLIKIAFSQLSDAGIKEENIIDSGLCTKCNEDALFSFRGRDKKKRMLSLVALK